MNYNQSSLPVRVLMNLSFFHAAFEGLLVNELRTTQLKDHKVCRRARRNSCDALQLTPSTSRTTVRR